MLNVDAATVSSEVRIQSAGIRSPTYAELVHLLTKACFDCPSSKLCSTTLVCDRPNVRSGSNTLILRRTNQILTIIMLATAVVGLRFLVVGCASAVEAPLTIVVDLSRGRLVCLSKRARKVIVSDPAVLQVTISTDGMILTGLDLGETTMVVLDERGTVVMESTVRVESASEPDIFVQRGLERRAYHCAPLCKLVSVTSDGGGGGTGANAKTNNSAAARSTDSNQTQPAGGKGL
jgi:hypothetical protein